MTTDGGAVPYKDRRGWLIFFGLVELGIGALCLLLFTFTLVAFAVAANTHAPGAVPLRPMQMIGSLSIYLIAGVVLVILGVGSMMARRWARDLSLVVSWAWLIFGVLTTLALIFVVPRFIPQMPADRAPSMMFVMTCLTVVFGIFGVVIPLALLLFYRSPNVRATCLAADPHPRWTERVPLPLLGFVLWTVVSGLSMMTVAPYAVFPAGSQIITGPVAVVIYCALGLLFLYIAWGLYRRSIAAWWIDLGYSVVATIYWIVVFRMIDYEKLTSAMHIPKTPGMPDFVTMYRSPWFLAYLALFWLVYVGYLLFVRRYFPSTAGAAVDV